MSCVGGCGCDGEGECKHFEFSVVVVVVAALQTCYIKDKYLKCDWVLIAVGH